MKGNLETYLKELDPLTLPRDKKMIKAVPVSLLEGLSVYEAMRLLQTDCSPEYDLLTKFYDDIDEEKNRLIKEVTSFYYNRSNYLEYNKDGLSPKEIWDLISNMILRIRRLMLVYNPDFYSSIATHQVSGEKYESIKINWLDGSGKKFTKVTRSYGKLGSKGLEYATPKLLESYFGDALTDYKLDVKIQNNAMVDFVAQLDGEKWAFEFKATNKNDFIDTAMRLELWKIYRETYMDE